MYCRTYRAFTLVEMLVVIAVIGLVAAIVMPILALSRQRGKQAVCISNLRQLGMAASQYAADNNNMMFPGRDFADDTGGIMHWNGYQKQDAIDVKRGPLQDYIKSAEIWYCPSSTNLRDKYGKHQLGFPTYGLSIAYVRAQNSSGDPIGVSQITAPADTMLIADCATYGNSGPAWGKYIYLPSDHSPSVYGCHSGRANVLWFDGHVSTRKPIASYPVASYPPGSQVSIQELQNANLGDILRGPMTGDKAVDDYYYDLAKQ